MPFSPFIALLSGALLAATGQVLLKLGADGAVDLRHFLNLRIASGLFAYLLGTVLWIWSLSRVPLSVAYGFTAFTFVLVYAASAFVIGERLTLMTYAGLGLVLLGFALLSLAPR